MWIVASLDIILFKTRKTKVLIRLRRSAGWSAPLLFANPKTGFLVSRPIWDWSFAFSSLLSGTAVVHYLFIFVFFTTVSLLFFILWNRSRFIVWSSLFSGTAIVLCLFIFAFLYLTLFINFYVFWLSTTVSLLHESFKVYCLFCLFSDVRNFPCLFFFVFLNLPQLVCFSSLLSGPFHLCFFQIWHVHWLFSSLSEICHSCFPSLLYFLESVKVHFPFLISFLKSDTLSCPFFVRPNNKIPVFRVTLPYLNFW